MDTLRASRNKVAISKRVGKVLTSRTRFANSATSRTMSAKAMLIAIRLSNRNVGTGMIRVATMAADDQRQNDIGAPSENRDRKSGEVLEHIRLLRPPRRRRGRYGRARRWPYGSDLFRP